MFDDVVDCPMCNGTNNDFIGALGQRAHFRCADCGWNHSVPIEEIEHLFEED